MGVIMKGAALALIAGLATASMADAAGNRLTFANDSSAVIYNLYVSPSNIDDWGHDRLGDDVLFPGEELVVPLEVGICSYDVRSVDEYGSEAVSWNLDVCT